MNGTHHTKTRLAALVAAGTALGLSAGTYADVEIGYWNNSSSFEYVISHMPDLDQERWGNQSQGGLPGDGKYYCVPTSLMNLAVYAANHGFPEQIPGPGAWFEQSRYVEMSDNLRTMGTLMQTDPFDGTTHGNAAFGMQLWISTSGKFVLDHASASQSWAPKVGNIGAALHGGGIVATCYGRYDLLEEGSDTIVIGSRHGGHCTTVMHAAANGTNLTLKVRDPASGGPNKYTQSSYVNRVMNAKDRMVFRTNPLSFRKMTTIDYTPFSGQDRVALLDSIFVIRPKIFYDWVDLPNSRFRMRIPFPLNDSVPGEIIRQVNIDPSRVITDFIISPLEDFVGLVSSLPGQPDEIGYFSTADGIYVPIGELNQGSRVTTDRFGALYAVTPQNRLYKFDRTNIDGDYVETIRVLPEPVRAFTYNDAEDKIVGYAPSTRTLILIDPEITNPIVRTIMPPTIPVADYGEVVVNPVDGTPWMTAGNSPRLYNLTYDDADKPVIENFTPGFSSIDGFEFDDLGHLFVSGDGSVKEFMPTNDGTWELVDDSLSGMNGLETTGRFFISRSNNGFDESIHHEPEWSDIPSDEVIIGEQEFDCPGDANADFVVDVNDLLDVLSNWGDCDACNQDFNFDNRIDVEDLLLLLGNWGPCN